MRHNRSRDTSPERALRQALWNLGLRGYRKNCASLPGKPDIVYRRQKLAIFVHGCFWHRCPSCNLPFPKTNSLYWEAKFQANCERDSAQEEKLRSLGFKVVTVWECQIERQLETVAAEVGSLLRLPPD